MQFKRIFSIAIVLSLVFVLAACGANATPTPEATEPAVVVTEEATEEAVEATEEAVEATEEATEEAEATAEATAE